MVTENELRVNFEDMFQKTIDYKLKILDLAPLMIHLKIMIDRLDDCCSEYLETKNMRYRTYSLRSSIGGLNNFIEDIDDDLYDSILAYDAFLEKDVIHIDELSWMYDDMANHLKQSQRYDFVVDNYRDVKDEIYSLLFAGLEDKLNEIEAKADDATDLERLLSQKIMDEMERVRKSYE
jgi:hypothetical protein